MTLIQEVREALSQHIKAYTEGDYELAKRMDALFETHTFDWLSGLCDIVEELERALIAERDEALNWDGIGTVKRINAVLSARADSVESKQDQIPKCSHGKRMDEQCHECRKTIQTTPREYRQG